MKNTEITNEYLQECESAVKAAHGNVGIDMQDVIVTDLTDRIQALTEYIKDQQKKGLKAAIKIAINNHSKHKAHRVWSVKKEGSQTLYGGDYLIIEVELEPRK